ncbi:Uncharacterized protein DBV15_09662 [Temnothorax longispinosus]|uniref:Uncharacterized protein n=1 Tax=Temnothorax longispinosus TaxID=300112 RepID=A0A4V6RGQ9_9HYME|nr:Uncharacterized protein DBV15_09662 [Temnothorax longispinosus]
MQVAPSGTACKRIYESTYALPVGRKRRAASAMRRWTVGCPASSDNSFASARRKRALSTRFLRASPRPFPRPPAPGTLVVQPSADTLDDSIKSDRDGDNSITVIHRKYFAPPGGDRSTCRYHNNDVVGSHAGKFDNFQPFAPARTWEQL